MSESNQSRSAGGRLLRRAAVVAGLFAILAGAGLVDRLPLEAARPVLARVEPTVGDGSAVKRSHRWSRLQIERALAQRADALRRGDEQGYLAWVDPAQPELRVALQVTFANLHRLGLGQWSELIEQFDSRHEGSWVVRIEQHYCFGDPMCRPASRVIQTWWRLHGDGLVLTRVGPGETGPTVGPPPWETAELVAATGPRTIVAASSAAGIRPEDYLGPAEAAASVADSFARWEGGPSRYVIFLASDTEFTTWFGRREAAAGLYVARDQVLIRQGSLDDPSFRRKVLTHELTHAATLPAPSFRIDHQWLVEGVAELATMRGRPVSEYNWLPAVRRSLSPAAARMTQGERTNADYGVWFLSVRYLADTFGDEALLGFFHHVVHLEASEPDAALASFSRDWPTLQAEIDQYIRSVV